MKMFRLNDKSINPMNIKSVSYEYSEEKDRNIATILFIDQTTMEVACSLNAIEKRINEAMKG